MLSDIEIARSVKLRPINEVAEELGLKEEQIENYGRYIAKVETGAIDKSKFAGHHLILVTAISPTKAGNGKKEANELNVSRYAEIIGNAEKATDVTNGRTVLINKNVKLRPRQTMILEF